MTDGFTPKLPVVAGRSLKNIEDQALAIVQWHYPGVLDNPQPFPVPEFSEFGIRDAYSFKLGPRQMPADIEAFCDTTHGIVYLREDVYDGMWDGDTRSRFTACHEIGHLILHSSTRLTFTEADQLGMLYRRKDQIRPYEDPEWQANAFSAALLMPAPAVETLVTRVGFDVSAMSETFLVSYSAAEIRLEKLIEKGWIQAT